MEHLACRYLSALLGFEVTVAKVGLNSYRGLVLENVAIREKELSATVPRMFLFAGFGQTGRLSVKRIVFDKPVFLLHEPERCLFLFKKAIVMAAFPTIVVNEGRLIRQGQTVRIRYLRLTGFTSKSGFAAAAFANLALTCNPENPASKMNTRLVGTVSAVGKPGANIRDSKIRASACLAELSLAGLEAKEFRAKAKFLNGKLSFSDITAQVYGGTLKGSSEIQVESGEFSLECDVSALKLAELAESIKPGASDITGQLDINASVKGKANNPQSWNGKGSARIRNGKLWDVPVFYGLVTLIMKPAFKPGIFRQGTADFRVRGGAISTSNLRLIGEDVGVDARGELKFDGNLDFTVTTAFTRAFMAKDPGVIEITSILSRILDFFIVQHHIGGTLSEPSYQFIPLPVITTIPFHIKNILRTLFPRRVGEIP